MPYFVTQLALQSLPEENFRQILALLPLSQRIRSAELVSRHWRQALRDQEVLSVVDFAQDPSWRNQVQSALSVDLVHLCTIWLIYSPHGTHGLLSNSGQHKVI